MSSAVPTAAPDASDYRAALASIIEDTIAPAAGEVDRSGTYPRPGLDVLGATGILRLLSSSEVGGGGGSPRSSSRFRRPADRPRWSC